MKITEYLFGDDLSLDRRSFLRLSGLMGLGVASTCLVPVAAEAVKFDSKSFKVSRTRLGIGTVVSMTLIHSSRDQAEEVMGLAFEEIDRLTGLMNRFDQSSAVGHLNKEGQLRDLPPEVVYVIERSLYYNRLTEGAFDVTVKPVVDLFAEKMGGEKKAIPTEKELTDLLRLIGSQKMELKGNSVSFKMPGMGITLDGIAKGYIVDRACEVLARHHIDNYLVSAAGEIRAFGSRGDHKPWTVAIQDPLKRKNYPDVVEMRDGAISTSGNYECFFDEEKMFHHIVDPSTAHSPHFSTSVSIMARSNIESDAIATGLFVMPPAKGVELIESLPQCECLIIDTKGTLTRSKGWKKSATA